MVVLATALLAGSLLATGAQAHGGGGGGGGGVIRPLHLHLLSGDPIRKLPARGFRNLKGLTWRTAGTLALPGEPPPQFTHAIIPADVQHPRIDQCPIVFYRAQGPGRCSGRKLGAGGREG